MILGPVLAPWGCAGVLGSFPSQEGSESSSVLPHRPLLSSARPGTARAGSGAEDAGMAACAPAGAAADRPLFQQPRHSLGILSEKTGL